MSSLDDFIDGLPDLSGGDPELQQALTGTGPYKGLSPGGRVKPNKWNGGETRTRAEILQAEQQAQAPKTNTLDAAIDRMPALASAPVPEEGPFQSALIGAGKTLTQLGRGVQQAYYGATGDQAAQDALAAKVADEARLYQPLQQVHPVATAVGEAAPSLAGGPLTMAAQGALEYGTPQEKAERAAAGFIGGKAGELVGKGIGRVVQPVRDATADATKALFDKYGISALPGQIADSAPVQWATDALANLPGGGRIRAIMAQQQQGLNRGVMGSMGSTADAVTPEGVQAAKTALGDVFQNVPKGQTVQIGPDVAQQLLEVESNHLKNLSPDQRTIVRQYVDDILAHGENGMPGDVYQKARSRIAARANSTQDSELKTALTGIYKTLDQAFVDSASSDAVAAMQTARAQYSAAKTFEPMAKPSGDISPARVANAAKNLPPSARDLANLGDKLRSLPNSGTAQRLFYQSILSGGAGLGAGLQSGDPTEAAKWAGMSVAAPWLATQMLTRAPLRNYLSTGLMNVSPEIEAALKRLGAGSGGLLGLSLAP